MRAAKFLTNIDVPAVAYLLTFSTYGTHLPGSEKGWVDAQHRVAGSPVRAPDAGRHDYWRSRLSETPLILDGENRLLVLQAVLSVCAHRGWTAYALHVRTNHVHAVVSGEVKPERMLLDFKAYATRALRARGIGVLSGGERVAHAYRLGFYGILVVTFTAFRPESVNSEPVSVSDPLGVNPNLMEGI